VYVCVRTHSTGLCVRVCVRLCVRMCVCVHVCVCVCIVRILSNTTHLNEGLILMEIHTCSMASWPAQAQQKGAFRSVAIISLFYICEWSEEGGPIPHAFIKKQVVASSS
jgi:hypothetical protein